MKPAPFRYARPSTLAAAIDLLASAPGDARPLAGGQSLLPLLNRRLARPALLVDLALVPELQVLAREDGELVVGAGVRQHAVETSSLVRECCPLLPLALRHVGHVATRARGTVGGSLAHADPAAELPGVAVALGASVVATGPGGRRAIAAEELFIGPFTTSLLADEVLTEVRFPVADGARHAFCEAGRAPGGFAILGVAASLAPAQVRLVATGLGGPPLRLRAAEETATTDPEDRRRVAAAAAEDVATAEPHRRRVVAALVARALAEAA